MGCGASKDVKPNNSPGAGHKALAEWSTEEVLGWYVSEVPELLQPYRDKVLPEDGYMVSRWGDQYLSEKCGLPPRDAARLLAYRDRAADEGADALKLKGFREQAAAMAGAGGAAAAAATSGNAAAAVGTPVPGATTTTTMLTMATITTSTVAAPPVTGAPPLPGGGQPRLVALLKSGVSLAAKAVDALGPALPFPGKEACALLGILLGMADKAITNHSNLAALRERAVAYLDLLSAYAPSLSAAGHYKRVLDEYMELLQGIKAYSQAYCSQHCIMKLIKGESDRQHFEELAGGLGELTERTLVALGLDTGARVQEVQAMVGEALEHLRKQAEFVDKSAEVSAKVASAGGIDKVLGDPTLLASVLQAMDVGQQMTITMLSVLLDRGPQRLIRQFDLQVLWKVSCEGQAEVPWYFWWDVFPGRLSEASVTPEEVARLQTLLASDGARAAFRHAVERDRNDKLSVYELRNAFSPDAGVVPQVEMLLGVAAAVTPGAEAASARPASARPASARPKTPVGLPLGRCMLPPRDPSVVGREEEQQSIAQHMQAVGSVVLVAGGGMGKSTLAAEVGWALVGRGALPGGALWVDLREASSSAAVEERFCAALEISRESDGNAARIAGALRQAAASAGGSSACRLLLVVDNAEDALLKEDTAEAFRSLLKTCCAVPGCRLLATSRMPLGGDAASCLTQRDVGAIAQPAAVQLVRAAAQDLSEEQAGHVAEACRCVPLVVRLVAEALVSGRMTLADVTAQLAEASQSDAGSPVSLVLAGIKPQHQRAMAQLAVLPSAFEDETAAELMGEQGLSLEAAHALLAVLYRHSLLQRAGRSGGQWQVHMAVRQAAQSLADGRFPGLRAASEARFIRSILRLILRLMDMFCSEKEHRVALTMARDRQADMGRCAELLSLLAAAPQSEQDSLILADRAAPKSVLLPWRVYTFLEALGVLIGWRAACDTVASLAGRAGNKLLEGNALAVASRVMAVQGQYGGAIQKAEAAVAAMTEVLGPRNIDTLSVLCLHAECVRLHGRYREAEPLYRKVYDARREAVGDEPGDNLTVTSVSGLAACIHQQGRFAEAEPLYRQALDARRAELGDDHPSTVTSASNLAICIDRIGRHTEAEPLYRDALERRRKALGDEHPDTVFSINTLAYNIQQQGRYAEAEALYKQAYEGRKRALGADHPDTIISLNNMAACINALGRFSEAEPLYRDAFEGLQRTLGKEHPDLTYSAVGVANCLANQKKYSEAETYYRTALTIRTQVLGDNHPDTSAAIASLANCIYNQSRYREAEPLYREAYEARKRLFGPDAFGTLMSLSSVGNCLYAQQRYAEAVPVYEQAYEAQVRTLGEGDEAAKNTKANLDACRSLAAKAAEKDKGKAAS